MVEIKLKLKLTEHQALFLGNIAGIDAAQNSSISAILSDDEIVVGDWHIARSLVVEDLEGYEILKNFINAFEFEGNILQIPYLGQLRNIPYTALATMAVERMLRRILCPTPRHSKRVNLGLRKRVDKTKLADERARFIEAQRIKDVQELANTTPDDFF